MADEMETPLNAYLYDFYICGSTKPLIEVNKIPKGDVWFLLREFSMILATVVTSLQNYLSGKDGDLDMEQDDHSVEDETEASERGSSSLGDHSASLSGETASNIAPARDAKAPSSTATTVMGSTSNLSDQSGLPAGGSGSADRGNGTDTISALPVRSKQKKVEMLDSWEDEDVEESLNGATQIYGIEEDAGSSVDGVAQAKTEKELRKVCQMFKDLRDEFDAKFKKTWS